MIEPPSEFSTGTTPASSPPLATPSKTSAKPRQGTGTRFGFHDWHAISLQAPRSPWKPARPGRIDCTRLLSSMMAP